MIKHNPAAINTTECSCVDCQIKHEKIYGPKMDKAYDTFGIGEGVEGEARVKVDWEKKC